ncbi:hypothetical protein H8R18_01930 [Nanchangia anserum]|uniref:SAF domain-containing protein n=1 Tax=Nanchangia anserum TaxID=2692125 RepID=A0A8I0G8X5_9ACTO|nr:SAF domain-containing protein [Nanchangia anserum]MBD3690062.1 hypothetical protein [Nanchangia anserum]QOX82144.1 hypothetical protein H8R18_01930 [Nanchangia anserum]
MSRRPHRSFVDPRFLAGVFLIVLSVILAVVVLRQAHTGMIVYQARADIAAGDHIGASDVATVEVRVPEGRYVGAGELPRNAVATRSIGTGELVAVSSIADRADAHPLVLTLAQPIASSVRRGDVLTLWAVPDGGTGEGQAETPVVLSESAVYISSTPRQSVAMQGNEVEVRVPGDDVPAVLEALAREVPLIAVAGTR